MAELLFYCKFSATALTGCWPSGISSSEQTKNAVKTALKAAVEQSEDSYNLVENKALSVKARAILEAYLKEVEAGYTDVFEPQNVTHIWPTDVTVGDDGFGTAVFSMPENAVDPQAWKRAANALVANFLDYYIICLINGKEYDKAEDTLKKLLKTDDSNKDFLIDLGYIYPVSYTHLTLPTIA